MTHKARELQRDFGITIAPNWDVSLDYHNPLHISLKQPGIAPCPYSYPASKKMFPGGLIFDTVGHEKPLNVAMNIIAASAISGFHEGLEWVMVDGKRIAEPHPYNDCRMWDWTQREMVSFVRRYRRRWPVEQ